MEKILSKFSKDEIVEIVDSSISKRECCKKLGYASIGDNWKTVERKLKELNISYDHFTGRAKNQKKRDNNNIFILNSDANQAVLRRHFLKENFVEYKCSICGLKPVWKGKPLSLTLDHINGIRNDNRLNNLRWVCPNCDRQLSTFGSKNIKNRYNERKIEFCQICGKQLSRSAKNKLCISCYNKTFKVKKNIKLC